MATINDVNGNGFNIIQHVAAVHKGRGMVTFRTLSHNKRLIVALLGRAGVQAIGQFAPAFHPSASGSTSSAIGV
jgi:hypothetical protein